MRYCRLFAVCGVLLFVWAGFVEAQRPELTGKEVYKQTLRGTVWIKRYVNGKPHSTGSGWIIDRDAKLILTNWHVTENEPTVRVYFPHYKDGRVIAERSYYTEEKGLVAKVLDSDKTRDMSLLVVSAIPEEAVALPLADASGEPGENVHIVGNPGASGALWAFSSGRIRQRYLFNATLAGNRQTVKAQALETFMNTHPGDSGGPVVNDRGEILAIHFAGNSQTLIENSIDLEEIKSFLRSVRKVNGSSPSHVDFFDRGVRYLERGLNKEAITEFTKALKIRPDYPKALCQRGRGRFFSGDYDTAIADLTEAILLDPGDAVAWNARGVCHLRKKQVDECIADCTKAIQISSDAKAYYNRGVAYGQKGLVNEARADFTQAIKGGMVAAYLDRATSFFLQGMDAEAEQDLMQALRHPGLSPADRPIILITLGRIAEDRRNFKLAEELYVEAVKLEPEMVKRLVLDPQNTLELDNQTDEQMKVYLEFERRTPDGRWEWVKKDTAGSNLLFYVPAKSKLIPKVDGQEVVGRQIRVWGVGQTTQGQWNFHWETPQWIGARENDPKIRGSRWIQAYPFQN